MATRIDKVETAIRRERTAGTTGWGSSDAAALQTLFHADVGGAAHEDTLQMSSVLRRFGNGPTLSLMRKEVDSPGASDDVTSACVFFLGQLGGFDTEANTHGGPIGAMLTTLNTADPKIVADALLANLRPTRSRRFCEAEGIVFPVKPGEITNALDRIKGR